jgi:hypothetical protein
MEYVNYQEDGSLNGVYTPFVEELPEVLKAGAESLSGYSMGKVQVHYNSPAPAAYQAYAYAQGMDIYLAPGQEHRLPHEAWHVVQQMQGRVKPTMCLHGIAANDNAALEQEADDMGKRMLQVEPSGNPVLRIASVTQPVIQRAVVTYETLDPARLTPAEYTRMSAICLILGNALTSLNIPSLQDVEITVVAGGNMGNNPAETISRARGQQVDTISINIQAAFVKCATAGELLGMLAHEMGVHNIPSDFQGISDGDIKTWTAINGCTFDTWKGVGNSLWDGRRQHDHLMVTGVLRSRIVDLVVPANRADSYLKTVLAIGDAIEADLTLTNKVACQTDLIHMFMVDIARIVLFDDGSKLPAVVYLLLGELVSGGLIAGLLSTAYGLLGTTVALAEKIYSACSNLYSIYKYIFDKVITPHAAGRLWIRQKEDNAFNLAWSIACLMGKVKYKKITG